MYKNKPEEIYFHYWEVSGAYFIIFVINPSPLSSISLKEGSKQCPTLTTARRIRTSRSGCRTSRSATKVALQGKWLRTSSNQYFLNNCLSKLYLHLNKYLIAKAKPSKSITLPTLLHIPFWNIHVKSSQVQCTHACSESESYFSQNNTPERGP